MPPREDRNLLFEDASIIFRNFTGRETQYNREGNRNFSVILNDEQADRLEADGWNVKRKPPREEGDDPLFHLPVAVGYGKGRPPLVFIISSKGRVRLNEDTIMLLDYADIKSVDAIVRPYEWRVRDDSGIKAYLQELFVVINESYLERKWDHVPEISDVPAIEQGEEYVDAEVVDEIEEPHRRAIESSRR